jgi:hypothetical protein
MSMIPIHNRRHVEDVAIYIYIYIYIATCPWNQRQSCPTSAPTFASGFGDNM